jgi:hypothetical protein
LFDEIFGSERVIAFGIQKHIKFLSQATYWEIDGTFNIVPKIFYQLVTIHCPLSNTSEAPIVPCIYILLSSNKTIVYTKAFAKIASYLKGKHPAYILIDFENALINSLGKSFPECNIKCCNVHLRRNIWKNIKKKRISAGIY